MGKSKNKITNWSQYNRALTQRGAITFWIDDSAIDAWHCSKHHGRRGRGFEFSDIAIETALVVKGVFSLPLRALQGFIDSIFTLMDVPLRSPNYSSISKRAKKVNINYCEKSNKPIRHIAIDSTGLKVFGDGEWKVKKHGTEKRRTWRKLHLAVDVDTHEIIEAEITQVNVGDCEVLPDLLNRANRDISEVSADGAYDTRECYQVLKQNKIKAVIPPRKNAVLWEDGHVRNEAVQALKTEALAQWKIENGYHERSLSETAMFRYKTLTSGTLSLRCYNAQINEALANVKILNAVLGLGMPERKTIA